MIFTYFGIILFLSVEWVKFIADSPVKRAERSYRSGKYGIPHQCLRSSIQSSDSLDAELYLRY
mgnify:CR=1 FL=1